MFCSLRWGSPCPWPPYLAPDRTETMHVHASIGSAAYDVPIGRVAAGGASRRRAAPVVPRVVTHRRRFLAVAPPALAGRPDGTWIEAPTNAFGNLINLAKGQREIVQAGTPILREIAEEVPVEDIDSAKIQELIAEMLAICRGRGVGLAAPQIGVPYRIFVLEDTVEGMSDVSPEDLRSQDRVPFPAKVVVNPVVTPATNLTAAFFEGCLSVQGYRGLVRRWLQVRVQGYGGDGKPVDFVAKGWQARIVQHEMDHLNGVLAYVHRTRARSAVDKLMPNPCPRTIRSSAPRRGGTVRVRGGSEDRKRLRANRRRVRRGRRGGFHNQGWKAQERDPPADGGPTHLRERRSSRRARASVIARSHPRAPRLRIATNVRASFR